MNKQFKIIDGVKVNSKIEWTNYTSNPIKGCFHRCRWRMPDGTIAICYAETVATKFRLAYPDGFEHHYWNPAEIEEWTKLKTSNRIFPDSMSDLMGHWVPAEQIEIVLDGMRRAHWHTFQSLTKNAARYLNFDLPANLWPGSSMPPDFFMGKELSRHQQERKLSKDLAVLSELAQVGYTTWMSFEPLSYDVSPIVAEFPQALRWAVIGAASDGPRYFQPEPEHVSRLLEVLDRRGVRVFFKGNLRGNPAAVPWREEFPGGTV